MTAPANTAELVERLRACANGIGSFKSSLGDYGICDEAASTIERQAEEIAALRKEVRRWKANHDNAVANARQNVAERDADLRRRSETRLSHAKTKEET